MFTEGLFAIPNKWKQPICPSTDEWIEKMWYIYTMEYYSAKQRDETLLSVITWMELDVITLSKISQAEKVKYHIISLACGI